MADILVVDDNVYSCLGMTHLLRKKMKWGSVVGCNFYQARLHLHKYEGLSDKKLVFHLLPSSVSPLWGQLKLLQSLLDTQSFSACTVVGAQINERIGILLYTLMGPIVTIDSRLPVMSLIADVCNNKLGQLRRKVILTPRHQQLLDDALSGFSVGGRARLLGVDPKMLYRQRSDALALLGFSSIHALRVNLVLGDEGKMRGKVFDNFLLKHSNTT